MLTILSEETTKKGQTCKGEHAHTQTGGPYHQTAILMEHLKAEEGYVYLTGTQTPQGHGFKTHWFLWDTFQTASRTGSGRAG
uniref:Uncharacterized protein n=2 Tax=Anguilla anguilla TaxID=7936 RepID=A0A0E9TF19_ANGAN